MARIIVWSKRALNNFDKVITYLETEWGEQVTRNFVIRTYQLLEVLVKNPEIGTVENEERGIRGFVLTKHNILFYRFDQKLLVLLQIFDTRQHSSKKI